jgi:hypothetical protein
MAKNYLEMTDEEIMNMSEPDMEQDEVIEEQEESSEEESEELPEEDSGEEPETTEEETNEDLTPEDKEETSEEGETKEETDETNTDDKPEDTTDAVDYESVYKRIMDTPIKANGKDLKLKSIDEAVQLIQMGANYNKKMASLKPHLKLLKTLENNSLLNENDINLLIDIKKNKPEAIAKLLSDAKINPLDVDIDGAKNYVPQNHSVSDQQMVLDEVISELQSSELYSQLSEVVAVKWDDSSRQAIYKEPEVLRRLHEHMKPDADGNSIYGYVSAEVERRRALGLIKGVSDYEAYINVGNDLYEQHRQQQAPANVVSQRVVKPAVKTSNVNPETVKKQKQAAAPTKAKATVKDSSEFNPLALSDEEFEKIISNRY